MNAVDTPNGSPVNVNDTPHTPTDNPKIVSLLENQIDDLKSQLETANAEKKELLDLANRLQKQNEVLMLPPETQTKPTWWQRLTGK